MNLDSLGYSLEEQIFYGVITLCLNKCTGEYNDFDIKNVFQETLNENNIEEVLLNLKPLDYLDKNYDNIYLLCKSETNIKKLNKNKIILILGYETARIKRILQEHEINWGTYNGHSLLDIFCSAYYNILLLYQQNILFYFPQ